MNYISNFEQFIKQFNIKKLSGHEKFLVLSIFISQGDLQREITTNEVKNLWRKTLLKIDYQYIYYVRAASWIDSKKRKFSINQFGLEHAESLVLKHDSAIINPSQTLYIFDKSKTHSVDKFLRDLFRNAKRRVLIMDPYVDETIFDNILDQVDKSIEFKLIFRHTPPSPNDVTYNRRLMRFKTEFIKFNMRKYNDGHDRFIIVDSIGYILGPSIKDAASKSPGLIVALSKKDTLALENLWNSIWKLSK